MIRSLPIPHQNGRLHTILSFRLGPYEKIATDPGPLGTIAFEVLALFANLVNFKSGRLDLSLDYFTDKLCRSRNAVVPKLKALRDHRSLGWLCGFEPVPNEGQGPRIRQVGIAWPVST